MNNKENELARERLIICRSKAAKVAGRDANTKPEVATDILIKRI